MYLIFCPCRVSSSSLLFNSPEWPAVERWRERHNSVDDRQEAEKQHEQQEPHVEVVGPGGLENSLMRNIAAHHCPALVVHGR